MNILYEDGDRYVLVCYKPDPETIQKLQNMSNKSGKSIFVPAKITTDINKNKPLDPLAEKIKQLNQTDIIRVMAFLIKNRVEISKRYPDITIGMSMSSGEAAGILNKIKERLKT